MGHLFTRITLMRFRLPGTNDYIRLFERVSTNDSQYDIFDCGFEYEGGGIDSVAVGGSFSSAKKWVTAIDEKGKEKRAASAQTVETVATPAF